MKILMLFFLILFFNFRNIIAQPPPAEKWVKIMVSPDRPDWKYNVGEKVKFNIKVFKGNVLWEGVKISYEIGPEKMPSTLVKEEILKDGTLTIDGGTMKAAGL